MKPHFYKDILNALELLNLVKLRWKGDVMSFHKDI